MLVELLEVLGVSTTVVAGGVVVEVDGPVDGKAIPIGGMLLELGRSCGKPEDTVTGDVEVVTDTVDVAM